MPTLRNKNKKIKLSKTKLKKGGTQRKDKVLGRPRIYYPKNKKIKKSRNNIKIAGSSPTAPMPRYWNNNNNNSSNNPRNVNKVFNVLSSHQAADGEFSDLSPENLSRLDLTRRNSNRRTIIQNAMPNRVLPHNIQKFMEEFLSGGQCNIRIGAEQYTIDSIRRDTVDGIRTHHLAIVWTHGNKFIRQYIGSFSHPVGVHTGPELIPNEELENFIKDLFRNDGEIEYWDNLINGSRWGRYIR